MKKNWVQIAVILGLGTIGTLTGVAISIYNKVSYDVLSYSLQSLNSTGMILRVVFGVGNASNFDLDIWNQKYDVYVSGYKVSQITSADRYKLFRGNTSVIPLDVTLLWGELERNIAPIGQQLQVNNIANLPVFIKGNLSVKSGAIGLRKVPVRWRTRVGEFLP